MNKPKCDANDYINFLVAAQNVFSAVEAAASSGEEGPAHDAYTRLLQRLPPDSEALWVEVEGCIERTRGMLVIDDTTLDKPYAKDMALVTRHWSGKHHEVVQGINLISLVWTDDGQSSWPLSYRLYNKADDGLDKNDHFQAMVSTAHQRGVSPRLVAFDGWYSSLDNLKLLRDFDWPWLTRLKSNRRVSPSAHQTLAVADLTIPPEGAIVHLRGYGLVKVFRTVDPHGDAEQMATSLLTMTEGQRKVAALNAWTIETYHRGLKQFTGIQSGQFRLEISQRNHIGLAIRAFLRLEYRRVYGGISWFETKAEVIRQAIRLYLAHPLATLPATA